jgi:hypothetical protein
VPLQPPCYRPRKAHKTGHGVIEDAGAGVMEDVTGHHSYRLHEIEGNSTLCRNFSGKCGLSIEVLGAMRSRQIMPQHFTCAGIARGPALTVHRRVSAAVLIQPFRAQFAALIASGLQNQVDACRSPFFNPSATSPVSLPHYAFRLLRGTSQVQGDCLRPYMRMTI